MPCTEAYREHTMYTFNGYCKTVIRFADITAWRDRDRRRQREISFEYMASLLSLTGDSPPASAALPCENSAPASGSLSDRIHH